MPKCQCKQILGRDKIYLHLYGCPKSDEYKKYINLPWYKKIIAKNPYSFYLNHLKI